MRRSSVMQVLSLAVSLASLTFAERSWAADAATGHAASSEPAVGSEPPSAPPAAAEDSEKAALAPVVATRRSGFTFGLMYALSFGTVHGYPNDFSKIDQPDFRAATAGIGTGGTLYLGGALTDWFTFGFGMSQASFGSDKLTSKGGAFLFHIEAFPLFARGGVFRDLGLFADFGTGTATIERRSDERDIAKSGSLSIAGLGVLWETWRWGHVSLGPFAQVQYQASNSVERTFGELGVRTTFYGGP